MEPGDSKVSFLLDGGLADRRAGELRQPAVTQLTSPMLARSDNTRLSVVMGAPTRAPGAQTVVTGLPDECHGIIPGGNLGSSLAIFRNQDSKIISGLSSVEDFRVAAGNGGTTAIPARIVRGGGSPQPPTSTLTSAAYDPATGYVWHVTFPTAHASATSNGPCVYVENVDGDAVTRPYVFSVPIESYAKWCAITVHGDRVYVWVYANTVGLVAYQVYISPIFGQVRAVLPGTVVFLPANNSVPDLCRFDDDSVVIWGGSAAAAANGRLLKYNVRTGVLTTGPSVAVGATSTYAVRSESIDGDTYIVTATAGSSGPALYVGLYDGAMNAIWQVSRAQSGTGWTECAVGFHAGVSQTGSFNPEESLVIAIINDVAGAFSTPTPVNTIVAKVYAMDMVDGAEVSVFTPLFLGWKRLMNKGIQLKFSETELYPLFGMCTMYSDTAVDASSVDFVDDPAAELYQFEFFGGTCNLVPVARYGVVRGTRAPALVSMTGYPLVGTPAAVIDGRKLVLSYLVTDAAKNVLLGSNPVSLRRSNIVAIDFAPYPLLCAAEARGNTLVAGAVALSWDGNELAEHGGPLSRPHIMQDTNASTGGPDLPAGVYYFAAYIRWRDASGYTHRSRLSNIIEIVSPGGTYRPFIYVSCYNSMSRKNVFYGDMETVLCGTPVGQPDFHEVTVQSLGYDIAANMNAPIPLNSDPLLYSTGAAGQELMPQPPPPLSDVAYVGARAWGLDAEVPHRAVYSKLRGAGLVHEFNPALEVLFPRTGGDLQRVFEVSGVVVFLAERAVWQVLGSGPDNTGANGSFSPPVKVSDYGCSNPLAACAFPGGIVWASQGRWFVMRGAAVAEVPHVKANMDVKSAVAMSDQDEIVFYGTQTSDDVADESTGDLLVWDDGSFLVWDDGSFLEYDTSSEAITVGPGAPIAKVYNYLTDRWSRWIRPVVDAYTHASNSPNEFRRHITFHAGELRVIDGESYAENSSIVLQTDWLILGGDFHDHVVLRDVLLICEYLSSHSVLMETFTDYRLTPTTSYFYSASDLLQIMDEQQSSPRYSIRYEPVGAETRAVRQRVTITADGTGGGGLPIALTLCYKLFGPMREEAFSKVLGGFK